MAFFSIAQSELTSSTAYSRGLEAQQLSKTALDMVIHQIRAATQKGGISWASQPGMIRTWKSDSPNPDGFWAAYKLYSDDEMVIDANTGRNTRAFFEDEGDIRDWRSYPAHFVDLNEPVKRDMDGNGRINQQDRIFFPILDPRAKSRTNPRQSIEGFDFEESGSGGSLSENNPSLPMPVRWIYQLEDGTLGTLKKGGNKTKGVFEPLRTGNGSIRTTPSASNPIVARFAFWADDESSKLNVNTAAGGVAWDVPRAAGTSDRRYGQFQPLNNEFQRYPGHPATTSLAPVISPNRPRAGSRRWDKNAMEALYELVPRVEPGGTSGGHLCR